MRLSQISPYTRSKNSTKSHDQFSIWRRISNQRRHCSTRSLQGSSTRSKERLCKRRSFKSDSLARTLQTKKIEENITTFKKHLIQRGYPQKFINNTLSEEKFQERTQALLLQRNKAKKRILPFVTQHHLSVPNLKEILTKKWYLTQQQPLLNQIFKEPLIISYRKGRSLKDILVRAKIWQRRENQTTYSGVAYACQPILTHTYNISFDKDLFL